MNIAGALSTTIFVLTILTVVAAILSYVIFKSRERKRKAAAPAAPAGLELKYFVEFRLPGMPAPQAVREAELVAQVEGGRSPVVYIIAAVGLAGICAGGYFLYVFLQQRGFTPPLVAKAGDGGAAATTPKPGAPTTPVKPVKRALPPDLYALGQRAPSLFPAPRFDTNSDGEVQPEERKAIHEQVPQYVVVTCDDNGRVSGLEWLKQQFTRHGLWSKVSFFNTGNYLSGRKNYLGGNIDEWWQTLLNESYVGLHGTTHEPGADGWDLARWKTENATVQEEMIKRLKLPEGWTWDKYPWGSRAPFLMLTDAYFQSLGQLKHKMAYDSSLVVHKGGERMVLPERGERRDLPWPWTLNTPPPDTLDPPYLPGTKKRAKIGSHDVWEFPMYAWLLKPPGGKTEWQPSMDFNLWKYYGCKAPEGNMDIVNHLMENLAAHLEGNRAPFHLGLHANSYGDKHDCERKTLATLLEKIASVMKGDLNVKYISIPDLLVWLKQQEKQQ